MISKLKYLRHRRNLIQLDGEIEILLWLCLQSHGDVACSIGRSPRYLVWQIAEIIMWLSLLSAGIAENAGKSDCPRRESDCPEWDRIHSPPLFQLLSSR